MLMYMIINDSHTVQLNLKVMQYGLDSYPDRLVLYASLISYPAAAKAMENW